MGRERAVYWWLPTTFILEVAAWEIGSRMELVIVDPTWLEFGALIHVERTMWILGAIVVALGGLFAWIDPRRWHGSILQLLGILALAGYWVGASTLATGVVVGLVTVSTMLLGRRRRSSTHRR